MRAAVALGIGLALHAVPVQAHPHVFIDAGVEIQFDTEGRATAVRVVWVYDDLTSLLIIEDRGLDPDVDGILTPAETASLAGFDMNWDVGFAGDTYALAGDVPLVLGPPHDWTVAYDQGRIVSSHLRKLDAPLRPDSVPLVVQVYDPGFYTSYAIASDPVLTAGAGCAAQVFAPDTDAAQDQLEKALAEFSGDPESDFPAVGALYAEEVRVTCTGTP